MFEQIQEHLLECHCISTAGQVTGSLQGGLWQVEVSGACNEVFYWVRFKDALGVFPRELHSSVHQQSHPETMVVTSYVQYNMYPCKPVELIKAL